MTRTNYTADRNAAVSESTLETYCRRLVRGWEQGFRLGVPPKVEFHVSSQMETRTFPPTVYVDPSNVSPCGNGDRRRSRITPLGMKSGQTWATPTIGDTMKKKNAPKRPAKKDDATDNSTNFEADATAESRTGEETPATSGVVSLDNGDKVMLARHAFDLLEGLGMERDSAGVVVNNIGRMINNVCDAFDKSFPEEDRETVFIAARKLSADMSLMKEGIFVLKYIEGDDGSFEGEPVMAFRMMIEKLFDDTWAYRNEPQPA
jgi:hypothetical protein